MDVLGIFQSQFVDAYNAVPLYIARAPGRSNVIGDHTDHQDYPVLPFCLQKTTLVATRLAPVSSEKYFIKVAHVQKERFPPVQFGDFREICLAPKGDPNFWCNYVIVSWFGTLQNRGLISNSTLENLECLANPLTYSENEEKRIEDIFRNYSIQLLVDGNLPHGAGLASSSSLSVAAAMAFELTFQWIQAKMTNLDQDIVPSSLVDRTTLANLVPGYERLNGTASGGMDQAVILLGKPKNLTYITFKPLTLEHIEFSKLIAFVVCDSCTVSAKALTASQHYNKRVFELKLGALMLAQNDPSNTQIEESQVRQVTLKNVLKSDLSSGEELQAAMNLIDRSIPNAELTKSDLKNLVDSALIDAILAHCVGREVWDDNETFHPYRRVVHVVQEAYRVNEFVRAMRDQAEDGQLIEHLAQLMNASHASMVDLFECGTDSVEELICAARRAGALGSRITGAGWGGCIVSILPQSSCTQFISQMKQYYMDRYGEAGLPRPMDHLVFQAVPSQKATMFYGDELQEIEWD